MSIIKYYQSIPELGVMGRMNTPKEFDKIGLPKDLKGKSVLDVGCNMGAFLLECYKRKAEMLIGIEPNQIWRWLASGMLKENIHPDAQWNVIPSINMIDFGVYDLVLCLSVTHVSETRTGQGVVDTAWSKVKKGGMLILEINDRLQQEKLKLPGEAGFYGKNKDNRSVWHIAKDE